MGVLRSRTMAGVTLTAVLVLGGVLATDASAQDKVYYGVFGKIQRANLDGTGVEDVVTIASLDCQDIELDRDGGKMYFVNIDAGTVQRANLDGSDLETLVSGLTEVAGIALDLGGGKMYYTEFSPSRIWRANLDGTGQEILISTPGPNDVEVDPSTGKVYWTGPGFNSIRRSNLDGSNIENVINGLGFVIGLELTANKMYFVQTGSNKISRANKDGTNVEDLVFTSVLSLLQMIAIDPSAGKMYWTDRDLGTITRANLNGSDVETFKSSLAIPRGIAVDVEPPPLPSATRSGLIVTALLLAMAASVALVRLRARRA